MINTTQWVVKAIPKDRLTYPLGVLGLDLATLDPDQNHLWAGFQPTDGFWG